MLFVPFLLVYLLLVLGLAWAAHRLLRRRSRSLATVAAAAVVLVLVAVAPVPVHGGFLLLGPELISGALRELRAGSPAPETRVLPARFARFLGGGENRDLLVDAASGLVASGQAGAVPSLVDALPKARAICAARQPAGAWAVPTDAEIYLLGKAHDAGGPWLAEAIVGPGVSIPVVAPPGRAPAGPIPVRCVAVIPPATLRGYTSADIPLAQWNAYQLRGR